MEKYSLKERVARIEGVLEQMDRRLSHIEKRPGIRKSILESEIKGLRSEMVGKIKSLGDEVNDLRRVPNNESSWILGVRLAIWVTITLAILFRWKAELSRMVCRPTKLDS